MSNSILEQNEAVIEEFISPYVENFKVYVTLISHFTISQLMIFVFVIYKGTKDFDYREKKMLLTEQLFVVKN